MKVSSGRRPVLALLSAAQVPVLGSTSAVNGLAAGVDAALHLTEHASKADVDAFAAVLEHVRSATELDYDFSREFAAGYTLIATELQRIGGVL